jgi:cytidyltransferase-like protein
METQEKVKIVLVSGGFDPIHSGHLQYFTDAKKLGDKLVVAINSDSWLSKKKSKPFMPLNERVTVVEKLSMVDEVITFDDTDGSALDAIHKVNSKYPDSEIIFANGGDRTKDNIPEMKTTLSNVTFVFGVGGTDKKNSSSDLLRAFTENKVTRPWGVYDVVKDLPGAKVKILTVEPGKSLSMQRHNNRNELWLVIGGMCSVELDEDIATLDKHDGVIIKKTQWHRLFNHTTEPCTLVEIQYGDSCTEEDIERK